MFSVSHDMCVNPKSAYGTPHTHSARDQHPVYHIALHRSEMLLVNYTHTLRKRFITNQQINI